MHTLDSRQHYVGGQATARLPIGLAIMIVVAILICYFDTAREIVSIWNRSETFAHGFVVIPISVWLLWRNRARLQAMPFYPAWMVLLFVAGSGFVWLVGEAGSVAAVSQFGLVAMLVSSIWCLWGHRAAWVASFPLLFLFFGVPTGEFLLPWLMQHTADFTIFALKLSGVPVYREGLSFIIPSGRWSVVEACSGIRYLIASLMVGVLFAYLNYRSWKRRILFFLAALGVPLVANWLRAYIIVMLGHLSGNRIATGVDHLIYGWLFFGIVILALFWVGSFWREDPESAPAAIGASMATIAHNSHRRLLSAFVLILVVACMWRPVLAVLLDTPSPRSIVLQAPPAQDGWESVDPVQGSLWAPTYVGSRASLVRAYRKDDVVVTLYVAYYAKQSPGHELVQWDNRLVTSENKDWFQVDGGIELWPLAASGTQSLQTRYAEIRGVQERALVWSWLWLDDKTSISDQEAKFALTLDRLLRRPDDSAVVMVYVHKSEDRAHTHQLVGDFMRRYLPGIERGLRQAAKYE